MKTNVSSSQRKTLFRVSLLPSDQFYNHLLILRQNTVGERLFNDNLLRQQSTSGTFSVNQTESRLSTFDDSDIFASSAPQNDVAVRHDISGTCYVVL